MKFEISLERLTPQNALFLSGAFIGAVSIVYFGLNNVLNLSPATKSAALLLLFGSLLAAAIYTREDALKTGLYLNSIVGYITFIGYTVTGFNLSGSLVLVVTGLSSVFLIGMGYLISDKRRIPERKRLKQASAFLAGLIVILFIIDIGSPQPRQSLSLNNQVNISGERRVNVGSLVLQNDFGLPRKPVLPSYTACFIGPNQSFKSPVNMDKDCLLGS